MKRMLKQTYFPQIAKTVNRKLIDKVITKKQKVASKVQAQEKVTKKTLAKVHSGVMRKSEPLSNSMNYVH